MMRRDEMLGSVVPKTLVGLAIWILMFGLGAALSGLIFFAVYQSRTNELEDRIIKLQDAVDKRVDERLERIQDQLSKSSRETSNLKVSTDLDKVVKAASSSIGRVEGLDAGRKPVTGSGFVVKSLDSESWVVTNYHLVAGSQAQTLPVRVRIGTNEGDADVYATDPARDLAVLVLKKGGIRNLKFSVADPRQGDPVWVVGARARGFGATGKDAVLKEVNAVGLVLSAPYDPILTGGPLLDSTGRVIGVLSTKNTAGADSQGSAVPINQTCQLILRCNVPGLPSPSPTARKRSPSPSATESPSSEATGSPSPDVQVPPEPENTPGDTPTIQPEPEPSNQIEG
ncbi:MAG: trypsin-like peptidase domain-containing protein [Actinomycetota bacterium]